MKLQDILKKVDRKSKKRVAVAQAADKEVLTAVKHALEYDLANFLLVGDENEIQQVAEIVGVDLSDGRIELKHVPEQSLTATEAVKSVSEGYSDVVMKGQIDTKIVLKAVLNKEYGLRDGKVLSHVAVFEVPNRDKFILLTDSGMNITPTLEEKAQIISNSVKVAEGLGINMPKVAPLAAVEVVNPTMPATIDAASLTQMQKRGQIKDCIVDGPLAFDNAVSFEAASQKGIQSDVAGQADILLVPAIEVANALYKSFVYFAGAKVAGVISGAKAPIVLTSRSDTAESKLYSLALALLTSEEK
ncbi:phosphate butyryltransferase [Pontibacillus salipaludis]|uniref:Phosphate butyryltransferase n=1 Tax=Pontibacillus salipaludis TaxID=1697394 RepID=A0ABQ1QBB0_9BACI|nr:phosphate butyryltransferase [Pontibacillus salipaludis]GGD21066.1 phosphate butyryltransferase [Pontibacillus salipaludis]